jgi:hypothetical protein
VIDYLEADTRCFQDGPVHVVGWFDETSSYEGDDLPSWALRGALATSEPIPSLYLIPDPDTTAGPDHTRQWVDVTVRRPPASIPQCRWQLAGRGQPPTQVCYSIALASAFQVVAPPASALVSCPSTDQPIGVDVFSLLPAACFGSAKVTLTGWLGVAYVIGDWDVPYSLEPSWLWSPGIGQHEVLSRDSNALNPLAVRLFFKPGSALAGAPVDRWVVLTGHLSDPTASTCRWVYYPGYDPATGGQGDRPDDASARANCAGSFVVDAIANGQP